MDLVSRIRSLVEEELEGSEFFIVDVFGGDKSQKISVLLDGDNGISIQKCAQISRSVSKIIDEDEFESEAFILEIGSPGADKPLTNLRQYAKHIGRELMVEMKDETILNGKLSAVSNSEIELEPTGKKKKKKSAKAGVKLGPIEVERKQSILFNNILQSTVVISFK